MSKRLPYPTQDVPADAPLYWRSLEEKARLHDPALYEERAQEFTPEQTAQDAVTRRGFMSLLGASMALVGAAGCRRPVEHVLPYAKMPEEVVLGVPNHYATVYVRRSEAIGLLVESHEGRPTKVEGNPDHPSSFGATDLVTQASILDLYDPDRSGAPATGGKDATWADFDAAFDAKLKAHEADGGAKLRFLMEPTVSPTVVRLRDLAKRRFPAAKFVAYSPASDSNAREGARIATGAPAHLLPQYDKARVIVSLDSDFLQTEPGNVRANKLFSAGRRLRSPSDDMSRLYVAEGNYSTTGANADHRLRIAPSQVEKLALALAAELGDKHRVDLAEVGGVARGAKADALGPAAAAWVKAVAADLALHRGAGVVVVGSRQPARVHALGIALNKLLGNLDRTVVARPVVDADETDGGPALAALVQEINGGKVETLVILGGNPVYDAPADLAFGDALAKVPFSVHLSDRRDETSAKATWHAPRSHAYEAWGDARSHEGVVTVQQPLIAPLRDTRSDVEVLARIAGAPTKKGLDLVRETLWPQLRSETAWKKALASGIAVPARAAGAAPAPAGVALDIATTLVPSNKGIDPALADLKLDAVKLDAVKFDAVKLDAVATGFGAAKPAEAPTKDNLEVIFALCPKMVDGRHANNAWLQELPDPMTKIVWDNAALISPATAKELGVKGGQVVTVSRAGKSVNLPVWIVPGHADNVVTAYLGWGRTHAGRVGNGKGFDVYPLRTSDALGFGGGAKLQPTAENYRLVQTQEHDSMEGRPLAREATLATYRKTPQFAEVQAPPPPRTLPLWKKVDYSKGHQWGMVIDLNACTGCNTCVVACQSENNILMVGKEQVAKGRELHWLRIDRYFLGDEAEPKVAHQPVACVHCEEAPCENVCPVNATAHSAEGLNDMAYNRCIGTRYCANNCPYKVRRFNYLDFKSEFWFPEEKYASPMRNPPETVQMQYNPDVTVRMRGVMEKCTYCVQRIQRTKIETKRQGRDIKDGEIVTACAQACPADAIVFGDLNDPQSRVAKLTELDRRYRLLADLGTKPRTTYLGKVRNPNAELSTVSSGGAPGSNSGKAEKAG